MDIKVTIVVIALRFVFCDTPPPPIEKDNKIKRKLKWSKAK